MDRNQGKQAELDIQRTCILFEHAGFTFAGVLISSLIILYIIYPLLHWSITISWFIAAISAIPVRIYLLVNFRKENRNNLLTAERAKVWETRWTLACTIPALSFVSSIYLPYESDNLQVFLFIGLVLISMIAGSIVSSITSIKTVMTFMSLTIIPMVVKCFMETGEYYLVLGFFFTVFYIVFCSLAFRMSRTVMDAIKLQIDRQEMAYKDSLTNLWNRRKLFSVVESMQGQLYSLLLLDVDHFKQFNDKHGHNKGDEMLNDISQNIVRCTGPTDLVVRYGGEEFLVLVPHTSTGQAAKLAEKIREQVHSACSSTISIGVADTDLEEDFDALVELADKAMYQAKKDGRNCVRCANSG